MIAKYIVEENMADDSPPYAVVESSTRKVQEFFDGRYAAEDYADALNQTAQKSDDFRDIGKVGEQAPETRDAIARVCDNLRDLLLEKNRRYGDSALKPVGIFTAHNESALAGLYARLDDKLARIAHAEEVRKNDVADAMGCMVLVCVAQGWITFDELID
jgi:hypothetical protein